MEKLFNILYFTLFSCCAIYYIIYVLLPTYSGWTRGEFVGFHGDANDITASLIFVLMFLALWIFWAFGILFPKKSKKFIDKYISSDNSDNPDK